MFEKTPVAKTELDSAIDRLLKDMAFFKTETDEYEKLVDQLVKLHALKEAEKPPVLSPDAKATILANIAGILLILNHERAGIVTSKALSFITKLR